MDPLNISLVGEAGQLYPLSSRIPPSWKMATRSSPGYAALISSPHQLSGIAHESRLHVYFTRPTDRLIAGPISGTRRLMEQSSGFFGTICLSNPVDDLCRLDHGPTIEGSTRCHRGLAQQLHALRDVRDRRSIWRLCPCAAKRTAISVRKPCATIAVCLSNKVSMNCCSGV